MTIVSKIFLNETLRLTVKFGTDEEYSLLWGSSNGVSLLPKCYVYFLESAKEKIKIKKWFFYCWIHNKKYKRKLNIIKKFQKLIYIFKLFNFYIIEGNTSNEFEKIYKNNLLKLNLFFYIFLHFFFLSIFFILFSSLTFYFKSFRNQT